MQANQKQYQLPDLFSSWPWHRQLSPYYETAKAESTAWVESFKPFKAKEQAAFNKCDFNLLGSLTSPDRSAEFVRVACDLMNFYFIYDEYTDVADGKMADEMAARVVDALRNPYKQRDERDIIGEVTRQFWVRALELTSPGSKCIEHFITGFEEYIEAVAEEADDRANKRIRSVRDYQQLRRGTTSGKAIFALIEFGLDLPDEVLKHPTVDRMTEAALEICGITNDMHSYRLEHARGLDGHNIITSIIQEHHLDLQSAFDWLGDYVSGLVNRFLTDLENLPSWGEDIDARLKVYIDGLGNWVRGNDCWCYESKRYYGDDGESARKTRLITLKAPERGYLREEELMRVIAGKGAPASSA